MRVTIYVPLNGSIEGITPPYRAFHTANDFLTASGKEPVFGVEMWACLNTFLRTMVSI